MLLFCAMRRNKELLHKDMPLKMHYNIEEKYRGDTMQIELDELIKRILQQLSESDRLTAEQRIIMYQRVFPVQKEANKNGKG